MARALATLVLIEADLPPLVVRDADRGAYIAALEMADRGEYAALVRLFARNVAGSIQSALSHADPLVRLVTAAVRGAGSGAAATGEGEVYRGIELLRSRVMNRLRALAEVVKGQTGGPDDAARVDSPARDAWPRPGGMDVPMSGSQWACPWSRLTLSVTKPFEVCVGFAVFGSGDQTGGAAFVYLRWGIAGAVDVWLPPEFPRRNHMTRLWPLRVPPADLGFAFDEWLEDALLSALDAWRRGIASSTGD